MAGLLEGKRLLITGVITDQSIAFSVAKLAQENGATVVLTGFGRMSLVERIAKRLPAEAPVIELDVTNQEHLDTLAEKVGKHLDGVDGLVHSIGFAPATALGGQFLETKWEDVATALHVSTFSYKSLAMAALPLMQRGSSVVGLTFDATKAWPVYDWMGVAKAGLESASRYLALHLGKQGIRSNLVSAGPLRTMAARSIPGFEQFEDAWTRRAPLGWDLQDQEPAAKAVLALISDWFPATTGEIIHVDGGYHALGAESAPV
ncbi:enoyl-[acyl-carrier-protein] reductase [NADH] [Asanoa ferruginea]|uniref:Enoyl-[acyl-carrier-protein] reductase [NADH] n=1 Tax=Asanoa ferruginea TaxID=53367 RepID=A0A3D9ZXK3_9ACTN|nr:enoyl-ACP reductase FabI [Asanoa ferruginea]REG01862.1 enoyl-[acyl-carrier-protein] reductase [NADH] [Asanoa ferruginea]GIF50262.1 enoyl-[acyl-carrier-protein] reductase [NADH] [Asanoa ferruginea]